MNSSFQPLQSLLEKELDLVTQFIIVLESEAKALTEANHNDALDASTEKKNNFAERLAQMAQDRCQLLEDLGFSADRAGLDAAAAGSAALHAVCQSLFEKAAYASDLNAANGAIITVYLEQNQRAMQTLRNLTGLTNLYDATGRTQATPGGRTKSFKVG